MPKQIGNFEICYEICYEKQDFLEEKDTLYYNYSVKIRETN